MLPLEELIGQALDDKYRIDKQLGQGGMGAVYLATHLGTGRPVALKIIAPQFMSNEEFVERFKREAKAAGLLRHPNVVDVTDFGFARIGEEQLAYLVMEYLDGGTLSNLLKEEQRLPLNFVIDIVEQICLAIDKAHQQGIIHRDLKPENIWLEPNERGGYTVKVLDFGLAKLRGAEQPLLSGEVALANMPSTNRLSPSMAESIGSLPSQSSGAATQNDDMPTQVMLERNTNEAKTLLSIGATQDGGLTHIGAVLGTPLYMSPEQCRGQQLDARSDIYSLGVITYQMLVGETPFTGSAHRLLSHHMETPPPPIKEKRHDIPQGVATLIMSALAKHPAERPTRAAGFASALRARSEGVGTILRKGLTLYGEHFPTFTRISLLGYLPMIVLVALNRALLLLGLLPHMGQELNTNQFIIAICFSIIAGLLVIFSTMIFTGVFVPVLTQLLIAPLRSIQSRPVLAILKARVRPLIAITLLTYAISMFFINSTAGIVIKIWKILHEWNLPSLMMPSAWISLTLIVIFAFLAIKALKAMLDYSVSGQVIIMEGLGVIAALKRSRTLANQARSTLIGLWLITLLLNLLPQLLQHYWFEKGGALTSIIGTIVLLLINFPINVMVFTAFALLYFKMRQSSGETLKEILGQYAK